MVVKRVKRHEDTFCEGSRKDRNLNLRGMLMVSTYDLISLIYYSVTVETLPYGHSSFGRITITEPAAASAAGVRDFESPKYITCTWDAISSNTVTFFCQSNRMCSNTRVHSRFRMAFVFGVFFCSGPFFVHRIRVVLADGSLTTEAAQSCAT